MEMPGPLVHVDLDPRVFNRNFQATATVEADAGDFTMALLSELGGGGPGPDEHLRETIRAGHARVWEGWMRDVGGAGVTPAHLLKSLQSGLGPDTVYTTDSGNGTFLGMECLRLERPGLFLAPVDFSCMGYSVPAAIGAKLGAPDSPVVALAGDGAFLMTGLEMLTAAREGTGVIVLVLRDEELAQIAQFQDTALSRKTLSSVADYNLAELSRGMGIQCLSMTADEEVPSVVAKAAAIAEGGRPALLDVTIDYSRKTFFTQGVVKANLLRLPFKDQARFVGRALKRKLMG
jgi:acetolactate synthase-1/2/3 large subunit